MNRTDANQVMDSVFRYATRTWVGRLLGILGSTIIACCFLLFGAIRSQTIRAIQDSVVRPMLDSATTSFRIESRRSDSLILVIVENGNDEVIGGLSATVNGFSKAVDSIRTEKQQLAKLRKQMEGRVSGYLNE